MKGAVDTRKRKLVVEEAKGSYPQGDYKHPDLEEGEIYQPYIHEYVDDDCFDENVDDAAYALSKTELISAFQVLHAEEKKLRSFEDVMEKQLKLRMYSFEQVKNKRRVISILKIGKEWYKARERVSTVELGL